MRDIAKVPRSRIISMITWRNYVSSTPDGVSHEADADKNPALHDPNIPGLCKDSGVNFAHEIGHRPGVI